MSVRTAKLGPTSLVLDMPHFGNLLWEDEVSGTRTYGTASDPDLVRFVSLTGVTVDVDLRSMRHSVRTSAAATEVAHILESYVFPRIAAHDGRLVLHGSTVVQSNVALIFVGQTGRGKTTLMSSFRTMQDARIGDDSLLCSFPPEGPAITAINRSFRLLPDSLDALSVPEAGSAIGKGWSKRRIEIKPGSAVDTPVRIGALFSLAPETGSDEIIISELGPGNACMEVIGNSFAVDPKAAGPAKKRMDAAAKLVETVPCFSLSYPRNYARLPAVQRAILEVVSARQLPNPA